MEAKKQMRLISNKKAIGKFMGIFITAIIVVVVITGALVAWDYTGIVPGNVNHNLPFQPTPIPTNGPTVAPVLGTLSLTLNVPFSMFNNTAVAAASTCPQAILFNSQSLVPSSVVGISSSGAAITGTITPTNTYYLLVAPSSTGTFGTLDSLIGGNGLNLGPPTLVTYQSNYWTEYTVNFLTPAASATSLVAGVNLVGYQAETPTLVSYQNATSIGSTSYGYATTTAYFSGWAGTDFGQGYKITRMQVEVGYNASGSVFTAVTSQSLNATAVDAGQYVLQTVTVSEGNGAPLVSAGVSWAGVSNSYYEINNAIGTANYFDGQTGSLASQIFYGVPILYSAADSPSSTMLITMKWYGKEATAVDSIYYALKVYYVSPTGTTGVTGCNLDIS